MLKHFFHEPSQFDTNFRKKKWIGPLVSLLAIAVIHFISGTAFKIPNPPSILVTILVYSAFMGGTAPGFLSAVMTWAYIAYFFSLPGQPFHYDEENFRRVFVWAITIPLTAWMVGYLRNRLALQEREREAEVRDETLMSVIVNSPSALSLKDTSGRYTIANPNYDRYLGVASESMIGKTDYDLFPKEVADTLRAHDLEVIESKEKNYTRKFSLKNPGLNASSLRTSFRSSIPPAKFSLFAAFLSTSPKKRRPSSSL